MDAKEKHMTETRNGALSEKEWRKYGQWVPSLSLYMASYGSVKALLAQRPASFTVEEVLENLAAVLNRGDDSVRILGGLRARLQPAPKTPEERVEAILRRYKVTLGITEAPALELVAGEIVAILRNVEANRG